MIFVALFAAVSTLGPALLGGPMEAAGALRPFGWIAAVCLVAGFRLGLVHIRTPDRLPETSAAWWALGWLGAFAMICVVGTWVFQAISGELIGIGPSDPPELNPFGGPSEADVQYQLQISTFGVPLLLPWAHLLWARRSVMRANNSLQRP
jgi:hypothetical protein